MVKRFKKDPCLKFLKVPPPWGVDLRGVRGSGLPPSENLKLGTPAAARARAFRRRQKERQAWLAKYMLSGGGPMPGDKGINFKRQDTSSQRPPAGSLLYDRMVIEAMTDHEWLAISEIQRRLDWDRYPPKNFKNWSDRKLAMYPTCFVLLHRFVPLGIAEVHRTGPAARGYPLRAFYRLTPAGAELKTALERGETPVPAPHRLRFPVVPAGGIASDQKTLCTMLPGLWHGIVEILKLRGEEPGKGEAYRQGAYSRLRGSLRRLIGGGAIERGRCGAYRLTALGEKLREGLLLIEGAPKGEAYVSPHAIGGLASDQETLCAMRLGKWERDGELVRRAGVLRERMRRSFKRLRRTGMIEFGGIKVKHRGSRQTGYRLTAAGEKLREALMLIG